MYICRYKFMCFSRQVTDKCIQAGNFTSPGGWIQVPDLSGGKEDVREKIYYNFQETRKINDAKNYGHVLSVSLVLPKKTKLLKPWLRCLAVSLYFIRGKNG